MTVQHTMELYKAFLNLTPNDQCQVTEAVTNLQGQRGSFNLVWAILDHWGYQYESTRPAMNKAILAALRVWRDGGCTLDGWIAEIE